MGLWDSDSAEPAITTEIVNVASQLADMAGREPGRAAVILPRVRNGQVTDKRLSFAELDELSGHLARGMVEIGIKRGTRTVLMVPPSLEFFALTFALFKVGAVPVLIDPGMGVRNLGPCLDGARPEAFIGVPKAHVARRLLGWARGSVHVTVTTGRRLFGGQHTIDRIRCLGEKAGPPMVADTRADEMAAILFTSGSTGPAKGVVYTHRIFAAQVEYLRSVYGIEPGEVDLSTFPLFALFGPALGMTAVIPEMDPTRPAQVNSSKIIKLVQHYKVTNLFGSPALILRVGQYGGSKENELPSLRRVISAGAPVAAKVIETLTRMLSPGVQVFTPFGATESLPVANIGSDEILGETRHLTDKGEGVCVGRPVSGMTARIIPICEESIPTFDLSACLRLREIGEIVVNGPVVTAEYFGRPEATNFAKMRDAEGRLWHRMGDVGYLDERGRLWFCGRKSHRVVTPEGPMYTIPCEGVFNAHPVVYRTALVGVNVNGRIKPVICVEKWDWSNLSGEIKLKMIQVPWPELERQLREMGAKYPVTKPIDIFLEHPGFPVDVRHNAKIFREKLAVWAAKRLRSKRKI